MKAENSALIHKSEHQWIRFYEGSIRDLEKKLAGETAQTRIMVYQKEIAERKSRIAKIKAEIGE